MTEAGVEVQPEKFAAVQNWATPRNLTELRSFVGLCSYYRRFISEFANVAAPLHQLTRKNARFIWDLEQDRAFRLLKEKLTAAHIAWIQMHLMSGLQQCCPRIKTDKKLCWAMRPEFLQEQNETDVTRRELLAVVCGLKAYRQYLLGRQFCHSNRSFGSSVFTTNCRTDWTASSLADIH